MVEISSEIVENIKKYINLLEVHGFPIKQAYLFGSYASGKQDEWSDIDIAIISDKFEGNRYLDKEKILGLYRQIDLRLSPLPLNPSSLEESPFVFSEIVKKGIKLL